MWTTSGCWSARMRRIGVDPIDGEPGRQLLGHEVGGVAARHQCDIVHEPQRLGMIVGDLAAADDGHPQSGSSDGRRTRR